MARWFWPFPSRVRPKLPGSLFRYRSANSYLDPILASDRLYYARYKDLNDPCEFFYYLDTSWNEKEVRANMQELRMANREARRRGIDPFKAVRDANPNLDDLDAFISAMENMPFEVLIARLREGAREMSDERRAAMLEAQIRIDRDTIGVCCFSEDGASPYMSWYYGDHHKGVCLEFSTGFDPFSGAQPVRYSEQVPRVSPHSRDYENQAGRMHTKSMSWAQEQEWRLFLHPHFDAHEDWNVAFDPRALLSVSFGPHADEKTKLRVGALLKSNPAHLGRVKIQQFDLDRTTYSLIKRELASA